MTDLEQNADLYWAARGAGPGFPAVVVAFHLQTRRLPPVVLHTVELYPLDHYDQVMTRLQEVHGEISPDVEIGAVAMTPVPGHPGRHLLAVTGLAIYGGTACLLSCLEHRPKPVVSGQ